MTRLGRVRAAVRDRYLRVDPRTAGVFRLVLGTLLSLDCLRHWSEAQLLYSTSGVLPNEKHLWHPSSSYLFSIFHAFSSVNEVHVLFTLGLICHLLLLVGYRTKLFAILSCVFVTSMDSRIPLVENGGYVVVNLTTFYACFLPIERRFSIDAWIRSWRERVATKAADLADRPWIAEGGRAHYSIVGALAVLNFSIIYFFNVVNKTGNIWRKGDTVHYVLHIDRMVTGFGVLTREITPEPVMRFADFFTLSVEAVIFACIVWPRGRKVSRLVAMFLIVCLHGTFGTMMRLGPFSWFMICFSTLLLLPVHWSMLQRFREKRSSPCEIGVDESSPLALVVARVVARLDRYRRITFVAGPAGGLLALRNDAGDFVTDRSAVARGVCSNLSIGPVLTRPAALLLGWLRAREASVTRFFALKRPPVAAPPTWRLGARLAVVPRFARELFLAYFAVCVLLQLWFENKSIPKQLPPPVKPGQVLQPHEQKGLSFIKKVLGDRVITLKPDSPKFLQITMTYPRLFQGWGMFAPNPIQEDGVLAIDAYTVDGRRIDPLTGKAPDLDLTDSRGEGLSQLRQDYGNRIRLDRNAHYRDDLKDYLIGWHELTKRPEDELVAFDVYWVRDKCPGPGSEKPTNGEAVPIATWRKPGYKRPPELTPIPPAPTVKSAEKIDDDPTR
jgi:hypothetical protein